MIEKINESAVRMIGKDASKKDVDNYYGITNAAYNVAIIQGVNRIIDGLNEAEERDKLILDKLNAIEKRMER